METIKCKECGQIMGATSESCPSCGAPVINEIVTTEIVEQLERNISSIEGPVFEEKALASEKNSCYHIPANNLSKVLRMINKYNKKAEEWEYEKLSYDELSMTFTGTFTEKVIAKGFWAEAKEAYRNGYLKGDFEKIVKLCTV